MKRNPAYTPLDAALPPQDVNGPHYLYAALLDDGVVKVGVTWSPRARLRSLALSLRPVGIVDMRAFAIARKGRHVAERSLIDRIAEGRSPLAPHREFFAGVAFDRAVSLAQEVAARTAA